MPHDCDSATTYCEGYFVAYRCECIEGYLRKDRTSCVATATPTFLPTEEPTGPPTPPPTPPPTEPVKPIVTDIEEALEALLPRGRTIEDAFGKSEAEIVKTIAATVGEETGLGVVGHHVVVRTQGEEYRVGDSFKIGVDLAGWAVPATLKVTSVGEGGTLANLEIVDGGEYTGEGSPDGDYRLTPVPAEAQALKADSEHATRSTAKHGEHAGVSQLRIGVGSAAGAGLLLFIVGAILIAKRRAIVNKSDRPATLALSVIQSSHSLTPTTFTNSL
jgi:hypothetical protein